MGVGEALSGFYARIEDGFFKFLDAIEKRGLPVYNYVEFLEKRGVPVFPFTVGIAIIVLLAIWFFLLAAPASVFLTVRFQDDSQNSLNDVQFSILDSEGKQIYSDSTDSAQRLELKGNGIGAIIKLNASKEGYESAEQNLTLAKEESAIELELVKITELINAKIRLVDSETGNPIRDAEVTAEFEGKTVKASLNDDGTWTIIGVPKSADIKLTVKSDGYEDSTQNMSFDSENANTLQLAPKSGGTAEQANIHFTVLDKDTKSLIDGAIIKLMEAESGREISSDLTIQGEALVQLQKGKSIKWTVAKDGYATFDSTDNNGTPLTLRKDDEIIEVILEKGGAGVEITVVDKEGSNVQSEALVTLFNERMEMLDQNYTDGSGSIGFKDLNVENYYYASAFKQGFLPLGLKFSPRDSPTVRIELDRALAGNTANVAVFVIDAKENPVQNATLSFSKIVQGGMIPLGMPESFTDVSGYYGANFEADSVLSVKAFKDEAKGDANALVESSSLNRIEVQIFSPSQIVEFFFQDSDGNPVNEGSIKITSDSGTVLFDGNIENARVSFDSQGNKTVKVHVETPEGEIFEETVKLDGKPMQTITLGGGANSGLAPTITFLELENSNGEAVEGIPRGQEGFLVFETTWPESLDFKGGIHVRAGSDAIKNVEGQDIAIIGFNAEADSSFFGRTYNPSPKPGNESIDFSNRAEAGKAAKILELYYSNPAGTKIVKVRVKASDSAALAQEFHYRAWAVIDGKFYRSPEDIALSDSQYSRERLGLYAETQLGTLTVFEAEKTACYKALCASFKFLDSGFNSFEAKDFKAAKGNVYALEIALSGKDYESLAINATTSKESPKIGFQGSDVDSFGDFPDMNNSDTSIQVKDVITETGKETIVRIYFKALAVGSSGINLQLVDSNAPSTHNFSFNIFEEKQISASFSPKMGEIGKKFSIMLRALEDSTPVENALIVFKDREGKEAFRIVGNGTLNRGSGGTYSVKNTLNAGNYSVEITAEGYRPLNTAYAITKSGVIAMPETFEVRIPSTEKTKTAELPVKNNSNSEISEMTVEVVKPKGFNNAFSIDASELSAMSPNSASNIMITASYNGSAESASASFDIIVNGMLAENVPATAKTKVTVSYNQKLDSACLEISPAALQATLYYNPADSSQMPYAQQYYNTGYSNPYTNSAYGSSLYNGSAGYNSSLYNSNYTSSGAYSPYGSSSYYPNASQSPYYSGGGSAKQIQVVLRNNCAEDLSLTSKVLSQNADNGVSIAVPEVELKVGEEKAITIDIENRMPRAFYNVQAFNYGIQFKADQLSKEVPLSVRLMSIRFALQAPDELHIYAASGKEGTAALFVKNAGNTAIENLTFQVGSGYGEGVQIRVMPERSFVALPPGQAVFPPAVVVARADIEKSKVLRQIIDIKGAIDGREYNLKTVNVFIHASAESCLKISPESISISEEATGEGTKLSDRITITNQCLEEVRISDIEPKSIGINEISLASGPAGMTIAPNAKATVQLKLLKKDEIDTTVPIIFYGAMLRSGKRIQTEPINLSVKLGKAAAGLEGVTSVTAQIQSCEDSTKKKTIKFPKIANGKDCGNGYCDAEQLADFIADKVSKKVSEVESAILAKNKSPEATCVENPRYCTFSELNARPETYTVYFQNDNLTPEMMRAKLENDSYAVIKGFQVNYFATSSDPSILQTVAGKGYGRQILLPSIKGCGKYRIRIDGAVDVIGGQMQSGRESVGIFMLEKTQTLECAAKIQNFQNFLPEDASLSYESSHLTWLGTVDSVMGLEDSARQIAQGIFKKQDRFVQGSTSSRLLLDKKSLSQGIVEITIPFDEAPQNPVTINAFIRQEALTNEKQKKETLQEAARAIASLKSNAPAKGSCITEDEKTLRITSAEESFGSLTISSCVQVFKKEGSGTQPASGPSSANNATGLATAAPPAPPANKVTPPTPPVAPPAKAGSTPPAGTQAPATAPSNNAAAPAGTTGNNNPIAAGSSVPEGQLNVFASSESCCAFTVSGNLENQRIGVRVEDIFSKDIEKFPGLLWNETYLKNSKTGEKSGDNGELLANLGSGTAKQGNSTVKKNSSEFLLCTRADSQNFALVHAKEITIKAVDKSLVNSEQNPVTSSVKIEACAIHPYDLVASLAKESIAEGKSKDFYAIPSWKGSPENVKLGDLVKAMEQSEEMRGKLNGKHFVDSATGQNSIDYETGRIAVAGSQATPLFYYLGACAATHIVLDAALAVPTGGWKAFTTVPGTLIDCGIPTAMGFASIYTNVLKSDPTGLLKVIDNGMKTLGKAAAEIFGAAEEEDSANVALGTGIVATTTRNVVNTVWKSKFLTSIKDWLVRTIAIGEEIPTKLTLKAAKSSEIETAATDAANAFAKLDPTVAGTPAADKAAKDAAYAAAANKNTRKAVQDAQKVLDKAQTTAEEARAKALSLIEESKSAANAEMQAISEEVKTIKSSKLLTEGRQAVVANSEMINKLDDLGGKIKAMSPVTATHAIPAAEITQVKLPKLNLTVTSRGVAKPIGTLGSAEAKSFAEAALKTKGIKALKAASLLERFPKITKAAKWSGKMLGSLLKFGASMGVGLAANAAGYYTYQKAKEKQINEPLKGQIVIKCAAEAEGKQGWDCELLKNQAYKVTVSKKGEGEYWTVTRMNDSKEIPAKAEWIQKCDGSFADIELLSVSEVKPKAFDPATIAKDSNPARKKTKELIVSKAQAQGVPEQIALGLARVGSNFKKDAVSDAGIGIMQVKPDTAQSICGKNAQELNDEAANIDCGLKILASYNSQYSAGIPESNGCKFEYKGWNAALRAYNGLDCKSVKKGFDPQFVEKINNASRAFVAA